MPLPIQASLSLPEGSGTLKNYLKGLEKTEIDTLHQLIQSTAKTNGTPRQKLG